MSTMGRPKLAQAAHRLVAEILRKNIREGVWPIGSVIPPYRTIAKENNVGVQAARLAVETLKKEGLVCPDGKRRLAVARRGLGHNFLSGPILEIVGTNLRQFAGPTEQAIQRGILLGAGEIKRPLIIAHDSNLLTKVPKELFAIPLGGVALVLNLSDQALRIYERLNIPAVMIDRPGENWKLHSVSVDNFNASVDATRRLYDFGHRQLAFARYASPKLRNLDPDSRERQAGFLHAVRELGLSRRNYSLFTVTPSTSPDSPSVTAIFRGLPKPTAILCSGAMQARLIEQAAVKLGLRAPRDFSLVCFQSSDPEMPHVSGPRIDFHALGYRAICLLATPLLDYQRVRLPAPWVDGRTVGKPL